MKVTTKYGVLEGSKQGDVSVFKGVPFAKPPVGDLRWAPPQEPDSWEGVKKADKWGNRCFQPLKESPDSSPEFEPPLSEDCLYLNVWTPAKGPGEKRPVAVWIHGGGFFEGSGVSMDVDGEEFGRQGIVLVSINYRLSVFGFFSCKELSEEQNGTSGNYGIMDQLAALRWVNDNIEAFGGDPNNVTIAGCSAGALSVQALVSSPMTNGLVHHAIMESGGGYFPGDGNDRTQVIAEEQGEMVLQAAGLDKLEELRKIPAEKVFELGLGVMMSVLREDDGGSLMFVPVIDGKIFPVGFKSAVEQGLTMDIDYMLGSNRNDFGVTQEMLDNDVKASIYLGCTGWSSKHQEIGRKPSYVYYFTRPLPGDDAGAYHGAEPWYIFNTLSRNWRPMTDEDKALSKRMVGYWTNFMKDGNPNGEGLPEWQPHTLADPCVFELNV